MPPNNFIEGRGMLWHDGNPVAAVDYHLTVPQESDFVMNPLSQLQFEETQVSGFILIRPQDEAQLSNDIIYTLQLQDHSKRTIQIKRKYKNSTYQGQPRLVFWIVER